MLSSVAEASVPDTSSDFTAFYWIVIIAGFVAFSNAFYIGANDVANAFASSVGAKSLKLWQAVCIAAVFEFLGALLLGKNVAETVRKGITSPQLFEDDPEVLMLAMFSSMIGATIWLAVATYFGMPVSTTHSIIGGVIGAAMAARGTDAVDWEKVEEVIMSWIVTPLIGAAFALSFFLFTRQAILRSKNPVQRTWIFFPLLLMVVVGINAFFVIYKGTPNEDFKETDIGTGVGYSAAIGAGVALIFTLTLLPYMKRVLENVEPADYYGDQRRKEMEMIEAGAAAETGMASTPSTVQDQFGREVAFESIDQIKEANRRQAEAVAAAIEKSEPRIEDTGNPFEVFKKNMTDFDIHHGDSKDVVNIHDKAERFDLKAEQAFSFLQVFTAIFDSFAHGANDVANSIGPFAAVVSIYDTQAANSKADVEVWILALGGAGIVVGLSLYGYKVIRSIGSRLTKITPSRGYAIELGSALTVVLASHWEMPVSTTQVQVGATLGVGLVDGITHINWKLMAKVFLSWGFTLVWAGMVSAAVFSFAAYSPTVVRPQI